MSNKDPKTLSVDPSIPPPVVVQPKQTGQSQRPAAFVKDHAASAADSDPDDGGDMSLEDYEASGKSGPAFQSDDAAKRHRELSAPPEDAPPVMGRVGTADQPSVPRQVIVQQQEASNKMVKIKPRITIARFRVGRDWYQVQAGKTVIVPKFVAELLEQKGVL